MLDISSPPRGLTGTLSAYEDSDVAAGVTGKVLSVHVERGSVVKKGDVLVKLDARAATASLEEARAQLALAKSQQALADAECERNQKLFEGGTVSTGAQEGWMTCGEVEDWSGGAEEGRRRGPPEQ